MSNCADTQGKGRMDPNPFYSFFMAKHNTRSGSWGVLALAEANPRAVWSVWTCASRGTVKSILSKPQKKLFCLSHSVPEKVLVWVHVSLLHLHKVVAESFQLNLFSGKLVSLIKSSFHWLPLILSIFNSFNQFWKSFYSFLCWRFPFCWLFLKRKVWALSTTFLS